MQQAAAGKWFFHLLYFPCVNISLSSSKKLTTFSDNYLLMAGLACCCGVPLDEGQRSRWDFTKVGTSSLSDVDFGQDTHAGSFAMLCSVIGQHPLLMFHRKLAAPLYRCYFTGAAGGGAGGVLWRQALSASGLADPAIRQIIWRLANRGGCLPVKRRLYGPGRGVLDGSVSPRLPAVPDIASLLSNPLSGPQHTPNAGQLLFPLSEV